MLLGQGGFGAVYRAWDLALKRPCAVKENFESGQQARDQFQQEASVLANLSHPNLPRVTDHFTLPGQGQYLVMDFVDGHDLDSIINQNGPLPVRDAVQLISQIADALGYLHSQPRSVIHRDIKPANIRVRPDGQSFLVDFGLVKLYATQKVTNAAARGITLGYSPPEQYGQGGTDARSDVYALGATLYSLLTGLVPQESVARAARDTNPQAHLVESSVPQSVSGVIARAMALDPNQRYQRALDFKTALQAALTSPTARSTFGIPPTSIVHETVSVSQSPPSQPASAQTLMKWLPWVGLTAALVMVGLIVAVILLWNKEPETVVVNLPATTLVQVVETTQPEDTPIQPSPTTQVPEVAPSDTPLPTPIPSSTSPPTPDLAQTEAAQALAATQTALANPIRYTTIGQSVNRVALEIVIIGTGEKNIFLIGGIHSGFAPSTKSLAEKMRDHFKAHVEAVPSGYSLHILTDANPDSPYAPGEKNGRLNANGVDLNRNWDCNWQANALWREESISGGDSPFSEPETRALRDYLHMIQPVAAIFYEARASGGWVSPGGCGTQSLYSETLASRYGAASGYTAKPFQAYALSGDVTDWLDSQGIPAVTVLLPEYNYAASFWEDNFRAVLELMR
jgi:serine/threonine protein kinase